MGDGNREDADRMRRLEEEVERLRDEVDRLRSEVREEPEKRNEAVDALAAADGRKESASAPEAPGEPSPTADESEPVAKRPEVDGAGRGQSGGGTDGRADETTDRPESDAETAWLNYLGIGLLLIGVVFLFEYAIERGWLTELVRVGLGGALGSFLLGAGLRIVDDRPALGQVLCGGGIGTFYATLFASFQLYELLPLPVVFAGMLGTTMASFVLSLRYNARSLALVGLLGGYATPFMLQTGDNNVVGLMIYTCVVTAGTSTLYLYRGWRVLLAAIFWGHWVIAAIAGIVAGGPSPDEGSGARVGVQAGVIIGWLVTGGMPVVAHLLLGEADGDEAWGGSEWRRIDQMAVVVTPVVAYGLSRALWNGSTLVWGAMAAGIGVGYALLAALLRRRDLESLASPALLVVAAASTCALVEWFSQEVLLAALTLETIVLAYSARELRDRLLATASGVVGTVVLGWVGVKLVEGAATGTASLLYGTVVGGTFGASRLYGSRFVRLCFGYVTHLLILGLLQAAFAPWPNGHAWVTATWAAYAIGLVARGAYTHDVHPHQTGLATIALVVGKLFFVDLAELDPLWRIVLFIGLGGGFLLVSYLAPQIVTLDEET
jgi:uncharacterized membrane protein